MQGAVVIIGEKIRDIDQRRNWTQADRFQPVLQPGRAGAIFDAANNPAKKHRALRLRIGINRDRDWTRKLAHNRIDRIGFQRAQPAGGQIARNPAHAQRIWAIGGDRNINYRIHFRWIIFSQIIDKTLPDFAGWQFNNPIMLVA